MQISTKILSKYHILKYGVSKYFCFSKQSPHESFQTGKEAAILFDGAATRRQIAACDEGIHAGKHQQALEIFHRRFTACRELDDFRRIHKTENGKRLRDVAWLHDASRLQWRARNRQKNVQRDAVHIQFTTGKRHHHTITP